MAKKRSAMPDLNDKELAQLWLERAIERLKGGDVDALVELANVAQAAGANDEFIGALMYLVHQLLPADAQRKIGAIPPPH